MMEKTPTKYFRIQRGRKEWKRTKQDGMRPVTNSSFLYLEDCFNTLVIYALSTNFPN